MGRFRTVFAVSCVALAGSFAPAARGGSAPPPVARGGELPEVGTAGGPSRALSSEEAERWLAGRERFRRENGERDGLGAPGFNATSCATCHVDPAVGGAGDARFDVVSFRAGAYSPRNERGNQLARMQNFRKMIAAQRTKSAITFDVRQTPSLLGLGLVTSIPDEEILRREDKEDANGDGVRGVASRVEVNGKEELGRFGWRAEVPRLPDFVCRALAGELGLTAPDQGRGFGIFLDNDPVSDPEVPQQGLDELAFFLANLAPPPRAAQRDDRHLARGEALFASLGCVACHVPELNGSEGPVALYSDLLLHEIVEAEPKVEPKPLELVAPEPTDSRGVRQQVVFRCGLSMDSPPAERSFRTAPLWGVGRTAPYLHDGCAATLVEAVLAHHGEAAAARAAFEKLDENDQHALKEFLESL